VPVAVPVAVPVIRTTPLLNTTIEMPSYGTPEFWRWAQERRMRRELSQNYSTEHRNVLIRS